MEHITSEIIDVLAGAEEIVIAGHVSPDGDAIGSCFSMALMLAKLGKKPAVLLEDYNERFKVIPGNEFVFKGDISTLNPDVFLSVDCANPERLGSARQVHDRTKETICIDHHLGTESTSKYKLLDPAASSASQLVFGIINQAVPIDVSIASALYAGIVFDTGGFRHDLTTQETMEIAGKLISLGIPFTRIYNEIIYISSTAEAKALGKALESLKMDDESPIVCMHITKKDMDAVGAAKSDLDGIVEHGMYIRDAKASVFIYEKEAGELKVSMRSSEGNVRDVAIQFHGGGHRLAAGCNIKATIAEAFDMVLPLVRAAIKQ